MTRLLLSNLLKSVARADEHSISSGAAAQIRGLRDGESVSLNDANYVRASRSGSHVVIAESKG